MVSEPLSEDRCGYTIVDPLGMAQPCDRPATGWRWYQDCEHEDVLDAACDRHANEGGRRMHEYAARTQALEAERDRLRATNDRLNRRAQIAESAINELATGTGNGKNKSVSREMWERCNDAHQDYCLRARAAEADVKRLRHEIAALAQTWGHEPHCDTRYGTCCATGQLEALLRDGEAS